MIRSRKRRNRGFTLLEMIIVIAVIAILSAVLIPAFSGVIRKSELSVDTQNCRNLNTTLAIAISDGRVPGSMFEVLYLIAESGNSLNALTPTVDGNRYAWDSQNQKIIYLDDDLRTALFPDGHVFDPSDCWIAVGDETEAETVAEAGFNIYLRNNITNIELQTAAVSVDTGLCTLSSLVSDPSSSDTVSVSIIGNISSASLAGNFVTYETYGIIDSLTVDAETRVKIGGLVGTLNGQAQMMNSGLVKDAVESGNAQLSGAQAGQITVSSREDLENIRRQIAAGRTFEGVTIKLGCDVDMAAIPFGPISSYRIDADAETGSWFRGSFDGQGYSIRNLSYKGFDSVTENQVSAASDYSFSGTAYHGVTYSLFGAVYVPSGETVKISNLKLEVYIDTRTDSRYGYAGYATAALIGAVRGEGTLEIEKVNISGQISGYDAVASYIGRVDGSLTVKFKDCDNYASVTGVRKTAGFIGSMATKTAAEGYATVDNPDDDVLIFVGCKNYGLIESKGYMTDVRDLRADLSGQGDGLYQAGVAVCNSEAYEKDGVTAFHDTDCPFGIDDMGLCKVESQIPSGS